jgi:hypothetical protein
LTDTLARLDRDRAMWQEWVRGDSQAVIGERYGVERGTVSRAVSRYAASIPDEDRATHRERALARLERIYADHRDRAATSTRSAAIVRQVIMDEARLLGLVTARVEHSGQVEHGHAWVPGPTLAEVLDDWRARGLLTVRGELTRTDQGQGA